MPLNETFPLRIYYLVLTLTLMRIVIDITYHDIFVSELTYQSLNGALPSRKYSIRAPPPNCKTSVWYIS